MDRCDAVRRSRAPRRDRSREIIFGHETFAGRLFDIVLLIAILLSVLSVLLDTVRSIREATVNCSRPRSGLSPSSLSSNTLRAWLPQATLRVTPKAFSRSSIFW